MTSIPFHLERFRAISAIAIGRWRAYWLRARGTRIGAKSTIGARCKVECPWGLELGARVLLEHDVYLKLVKSAAALKIGDSVFIGRGVEFDVSLSVSVGSHSLIAPRCFITDHCHGLAPNLRIDEQPCRSAAVSIGSDVWLGAGVIVLPGVTIGDGAVVGANSVVTRDVATMSAVAGAPARLLHMRSLPQ